jgi:hypothetical protein
MSLENSAYLSWCDYRTTMSAHEGISNPEFGLLSQLTTFDAILVSHLTGLHSISNLRNLSQFLPAGTLAVGHGDINSDGFHPFSIRMPGSL